MTAPALFDIVPLPANPNDLPVPDQPYYVIASNGPLIYKQTFFGRALVPVNELPHLPKLEKDSFLWYDIPPVPAVLLGQVWSFFRAVWDRMHSEAMVYLTHHPDHGYRAFVPLQENTAGGVHANHNPAHIANGWQNVGSVHSHCNFSASHSSVDTHDADGHDGLHITIGHVDTDKPTTAVMISINRKRWNFDFPDVIDGDLAIVPHPEWWHRYVTRPTATTPATTPKHGWLPAHRTPPAWLQRHTDPSPTPTPKPKANGKTNGNIKPFNRPYTGDQQLPWLNADLDAIAQYHANDPTMRSPEREAYLADVDELATALEQLLAEAADLGIDIVYEAEPGQLAPDLYLPTTTTERTLGEYWYD